MNADKTRITQLQDNDCTNIRRQQYSKQLLAAAIISAVVCIAFVAAYSFNFGTSLSDRQDVWGQFGDYLGGLLNPVFGFAGFLVLLNTLHQQRLQIAEERRQMEEQKEAQRVQTNEERQRFAEEHKVRTLQSFETTFFHLLSRFTETIGGFTYSYRDLASQKHGEPPPLLQAHGRKALRRMYDVLRKNYGNTVQPADKSHRDHCAYLYRETFKKAQHELGIYFRTLYHIFKFVDTSALSYPEKIRYANIARAQLSGYELALIFYNGLWGEGETGFQPLINKYGILKHIKEDELLSPTDRSDLTLYPEAALANSSRRLEIFGRQEPIITYD